MINSRNIDIRKASVIGLSISFVLLLVGFAFTLYHSGTPKVVAGDVALKCTNPDCDYAESISADECQQRAWAEWDTFKQQAKPQQAKDFMESILRDLGISRDLAVLSGANVDSGKDPVEQVVVKQWGSMELNLPLTCPECGQSTVYRCQKCENCGALFFREMVRGQNAHVCPECGFNKLEQIKKQQKDKQR